MEPGEYVMKSHKDRAAILSFGLLFWLSPSLSFCESNKFQLYPKFYINFSQN
jgi:hypothetical protein